MNKIIHIALSACMISGASLSFSSTPVSGPYIRAFSGFAFTSANNVDSNGFSNPSYQTGYDAGAQFGYKSGPIRYEFEGTYIYAKLNEFNYNHIVQTDVSGKSTSGSLLLNVYYDFENFSMSLAPYLGVGIGYTIITNTLNSTEPNLLSYNHSDIIFSYKALTGLTYNFSENISTDIGYQYFRTQNSNKFNKHFESHLVNMGLTYRYDN